MPRPKLLVAVGAAIFALGLIAYFPARVAYHWFAPDAVRLGGLSGTVWNGRAAEGQLGGLYVVDLAWRFRPLALLAGRVGYSIDAQSAAGPLGGDVAITPAGTVHLSDFRGRVTISSVSELAAFAGVEGLLSADVENLVVADGVPIGGNGTLEVSNLVSRQLSSAPLGVYRAEFVTEEDVLRAEIRDVSGVLELEGTLELRPDRSYALAGRVAAAAGAPEAVTRQLALLGSPDADGMRRFGFEGTLP